MSKIVYCPRNDYVLVKIVDLGKSPGGVLTPQAAIEGKEFFVEAKGPDVKHLEVGDKVLMIGVLKEDYAYLPSSKDLILIKQANIPIIFKEMDH